MFWYPHHLRPADALCVSQVVTDSLFRPLQAQRLKESSTLPPQLAPAAVKVVEKEHCCHLEPTSVLNWEATHLSGVCFLYMHQELVQV